MDPIEKGAQSLKQEYFERDGTIVSDEEARADFQNLVEVFETLLRWQQEEDEKKELLKKSTPRTP